MPKVSVIVPSYNHERYVEPAIRSVLDQTFQDFEIIVVDDASSDDTTRVVEGIRDSRIRLVRMARNRAVHTRNEGLGLATGTYIAFQNSDDRWDERKLETQIEVLENQPNTVACFTAVQPIDEMSRPIAGSFAHDLFATRNRSHIEWLRSFFETGNCLCVTSAVVRRTAIGEIGGFRESLVQMGDFDLWIRLVALGDFHIVDAPLTQMRILEQNKNLSAPSAETNRRSVIEFAEVLSRYAEAPVLGLIPEAFDFIFDSKAHSLATYLAGLAQYAWQFGTSHHLFADTVLARLIDDTRTRQEIVEAYGNRIILDFLEKRGELEIARHSS